MQFIHFKNAYLVAEKKERDDDDEGVFILNKNYSVGYSRINIKDSNSQSSNFIKSVENLCEKQCKRLDFSNVIENLLKSRLNLNNLNNIDKKCNETNESKANVFSFYQKNELVSFCICHYRCYNSDKPNKLYVRTGAGKDLTSLQNMIAKLHNLDIILACKKFAWLCAPVKWMYLI